MSRGRNPGFRMSEEHRTKIKNSQILNRLIKCALGEIEMSQVEANVGLSLMRKVLPDLSAVDHSGDVQTPFVILAPQPSDSTEEWERNNAPPSIN